MTSRSMNGNVVRQLILKDWQLHRPQILLTMATCVLSLAALLLKQQTPLVLGSVCFFIALIILGALLAASNVLNERKKQTLAFVMSLPVSAAQYATAKLLSSLGMFVWAWLTMGIAAMWLILGMHLLPNGAIPMAFILLLFPLVGFCLVLGMTLAGETEGWNMTANIIANPSYGITWYLITQSPSLMHNIDGKVAEWNSSVLAFLACEIALIGLTLGVTYYLQSKKQDFV